MSVNTENLVFLTGPNGRVVAAKLSKESFLKLFEAIDAKDKSRRAIAEDFGIDPKTFYGYLDRRAEIEGQLGGAA